MIGTLRKSTQRATYTSTTSKINAIIIMQPEAKRAAAVEHDERRTSAHCSHSVPYAASCLLTALAPKSLIYGAVTAQASLPRHC
mmetsp:Transcript_27810/g.54173  ORF Transcript_27810/g.54173 Transcript_27810/m.54173 type:complete len:84 (-) Transcript_27810:2389-2640(-)